MQAWIEESLKNGELFFYIVPAVLLILLLIVIFWPEKKKKTKEENEETELDKLIKADKKLKAEIEPVVENKEEPPFKEAGKEIQLFEEQDVQTFPETSQKPIEPEQPAEPAPVETLPETSPEPEQPAATIKSGLEKTKKGGFMSRLLGLFKNSVVDDDLIEELEEILYTADMGVTTVSWLMDLVNKNRLKFTSGDDVKQFLKEQIREVLVANHKSFPEITEKPTIFLMVGVNGAGKTTTIGKLAHKFIAQGKVPMLAAGDTFRAAAVEQLKVWGERNNCTVISDKDGADPASVAFNAVNSAISKDVDVLLVDTAGRLQNRVNLMEELVKINRVIGKAKPGAPHETIIVIDANNGQNALTQAKQFSEAVKVTGIIVTKLDGSAKGGVIIGISKELGLPVYLVGVGEKIEDLKPFDPNEFVEALFE
ncbi:signal recognition particle-docking protein FtsY [bacterium]|nr:signal recognition particle-docking protein FtsY [bacterium]MBQ4438333.1 signal recognition particle-docking protein FtsY [bacterium]